MSNEKPAGIIRLDYLEKGQPNTYEISVLVSPECWGKGVTVSAHYLLRRLHANARILAEVNPDNIASVKLFKKLNYTQTSEREYVLEPLQAVL